MTTITVSPSTHAKLVNDKTLELRSIEKVILDLYNRVNETKPVTASTLNDPCEECALLRSQIEEMTDQEGLYFKNMDLKAEIEELKQSTNGE